MPTIYGSVPMWIHRAGTAEAGFYGFLAGQWADDRGRLWPSVSTMAEAVGKSIRTVERWIANLKKIGAIQVFRRRRRDGTLAGAVYQLTWEDPQPEPQKPRSRPPAIFGTARTIPTATSTSVLRTGEHVRESGTEFDGERPMAPKVEQLSLDLNIEDQLDSCTAPSDNGTKHQGVSSKEGRGTAASRVMAWWISNRKVAPTPVQRLAMGGAIKQCLNSQIDPTTEDGIIRVLCDLMESGLDQPMLLRRRFGIYPKRRKQRDYNKDPLFMHTPRPSMLKRPPLPAASPPEILDSVPNSKPTASELPSAAPVSERPSILALLRQSRTSPEDCDPRRSPDVGATVSETLKGLKDYLVSAGLM